MQAFVCAAAMLLQSERFLSLLFGIELTPQRLESLMSEVQKTLNEKRKKEQLGPPEGPHRSALQQLNGGGAAAAPAAAETAAAAAETAAAAAAETPDAAATAANELSEHAEGAPKEHSGGPSSRMRLRSFTWTAEGPEGE